MKIKLKTQSLDDWELNLFESYSTLPIIIGRTMIFGAYNVDFEMTDNIWHQLPEEYKKKIYKYNWKKMIKSMLITVTDITAYSFGFGYNTKLKDSITMEEIYKNFDENKRIESFLPSCDFPRSSMSVYFQYLGEVYAEVDLDELVAIFDEENSYQYSIMPKQMKASNYRKERENNTGKLEQIYNEQLIIKNLLNIFLFGELKKLLLASNFYHSFSILLNAGIGMVESLEIMYMNNNNYYLKDRLFEVKKAILAGNNITTSFKNLNLYNDRFSILITVGEESGYLSENFLQISKILKEDFDYKLKKLLAILEPLVILILGLIVGFVVLAIYLPILSIGDIFI